MFFTLLFLLFFCFYFVLFIHHQEIVHVLERVGSWFDRTNITECVSAKKKQRLMFVYK